MPSVLLIDDDRDYCILIELALRRLAPGLSVRLFHASVDGLAHLSVCGHGVAAPDLILLDRLFPEPPTGLEVLQAARAMSALNAVPIYMLSAVGEPQHVHAATDIGADCYLTKPRGDLHLDLVRDVLERRPWQRESLGRVSVAPMSAGRPLVDSAAVSMGTCGIAEKKMRDFWTACAYADIEPRHAIKVTVSDEVLDAKRKLVVRWLLTFPQPLPWGVTEIRDFLPFSDRYIERCRAENRRKPLLSGGFRPFALK